MSEERFDRIEVRLDRPEQGQQAMPAAIGDLRAEHEQLRVDIRAGYDELRRYMTVLHKEKLDLIEAILRSRRGE